MTDNKSEAGREQRPIDPVIQDRNLVRSNSWGPYWLRGIVAVVVGLATYHFGLQWLGVHLEWFSGISGFNVSWIVAMSILPVFTGVLIGMIYGFGGKYLAHFPPAMFMLYSYQSTTFVPQGSHLLPWGLWIVFVILQMEFCAAGGFIGEVFIRRRYSWDNPSFRRADSEPLPDDDGMNSNGKL